MMSLIAEIIIMLSLITIARPHPVLVKYTTESYTSGNNAEECDVMSE